MLTVPCASAPVQLCYSFQFSPLIREAGKSRQIALDAIARDHGQRSVELILEQPGAWIGIEPGPAMTATPTAPRLPEIHPGCPANATVMIVCRIVKRTPHATLIELADDPRGQVWVSRKHVQHGSAADKFGCEILHFPLWLYRRVKDQL